MFNGYQAAFASLQRLDGRTPTPGLDFDTAWDRGFEAI